MPAFPLVIMERAFRLLSKVTPSPRVLDDILPLLLLNADWCVCDDTIKDGGKIHLEGLEEVVAVTHTGPGIELVPTRKTGKLLISQGCR